MPTKIPWIASKALVVRSTYRGDIQSVAEDRGVHCLLHFTQSSNLPGILQHGLLPRTRLAGPEYAALASAQHRLDGTDEAISVSISRLSERVFSSKRYKNPHSDWVVLVLSPAILWTHNCRFCWRNAATKEIRDHRGWRGGPWAFAEMFAGSVQAREGLARFSPTDPEAEVQVLDPIAAEHILGAVVYRLEMMQAVQALLNAHFQEPRLVALDAY